MPRIAMERSRREFLGSSARLAGSALLYPALAASSSTARAASGDDVLAFESALALAQRLRTRDVSSVELTRYFIDRIERFDATLNAIAVRTFDQALAAAASADEALARGESLGPLHGLPMTIKESFLLTGTRTTWGNPEWENGVATSDAVLVSRYKAAGAHFLGKTNVPLMLADFQSYNEIYGQTNNPWDPSRVPGGSSGGSAVALATGMTGLDSGSDIGGSVRNPAHFCGIYGHKPTWGIVPSRGQAPSTDWVVESDLEVVGPLARSAQDLRLALDVASGADVLDTPAWRLELPPPRMQSLAGLRVALLHDHAASPVSGEIADRVARIGDVVAQRGGRVSDAARPDFVSAEGLEIYTKLLLSVVSPAPEDSIGIREWRQLDAKRTHYRYAWQEFFAEWDVLVCPIMPTTAFPHDHSEKSGRTIAVDGKRLPYFDQIFWASIATLSYLPSTVFPTGLSEQGLPIGLQVIGAAYDDATTIEFARLMAEEIGGFEPPPAYGT